MAVLSDYVSGVITVTQGSIEFTGTNTLWRTVGFREGDTVQLQGFTAIVKGTTEPGNPISSNALARAAFGPFSFSLKRSQNSMKENNYRIGIGGKETQIDNEICHRNSQYLETKLITKTMSYSSSFEYDAYSKNLEMDAKDEGQ